MLTIVTSADGTNESVPLSLTHLISLHSKLGQRPPVLLLVPVGLAKLLGHFLLRLGLSADLLLILPILKLLGTGDVHLGVLGQELIGVAGGAAPRILGGHHLGLLHGLLHGRAHEGDVVHLLQALGPVAGDAHLSVTAVELVELHEVVPVAGTVAVDLVLGHFGRLLRLLLGFGLGNFRVQLVGEIVEVSPHDHD